jgi:uncharacterized membrane protein YgcG
VKRYLAILFLSLALSPVAADARSLHWEALEVTARLDAEGRLHVRESQTMVFTGSWNGGERTFRIGGEQEVDLHSLVRVDPAGGAAIRLQRGSLGNVDRYDWHRRSVLRWRSRLPSDPPFDNTAITYILDYTLSGVLQGRLGAYYLDHDFAFPDRVGTIRRFVLDLEIDPIWKPEGELPTHLERENLLPGQSVVLTQKLRYLGSGRPGGVFFALPIGLRLLAVVGALVVVVALAVRFHRFERKQGRYERPDIPPEPDRPWIEANLLSLRPEEVGAIWDQTIGRPEVAAVLARLVSEGRLSSRVEKRGKRKKDVLHLELLDSSDPLAGYERELIDKLFFDGRTEASTEAVREHYKGEGFSPTSAIRDGLEKRLRELPGFRRKIPAPKAWPGGLLLLGFLACVAIEFLTRGEQIAPLIANLVLATLPAAIVGYIGVFRYRKKPENLRAASLVFVVPLGLILSGLYLPLVLGRLLLPPSPGLRLSYAGSSALLLLGLVFAKSFFDNARTRDTRQGVRRRALLAAVRRHFQAELGRPEPRLDDDWFPYLLALGLSKEVDRWSVAHAGGSHLSTTGTGAFTAGSPGSGWTGGGGSFGGAGAAATWAAAASGLAAGVASPSSSSGGGVAGVEARPAVAEAAAGKGRAEAPQAAAGRDLGAESRSGMNLSTWARPGLLPDAVAVDIW